MVQRTVLLMSLERRMHSAPGRVARQKHTNLIIVVNEDSLRVYWLAITCSVQWCQCMPGRVGIAVEDKPRSCPFFSPKTKIIIHETTYGILMNTAQYGTSKVLEIFKRFCKACPSLCMNGEFPIIIFLL
jgi:hypothetical protein